MAKLTRILQQLFGSTGNVSAFGQPGSLPAGTKINTQDPDTIQALPAFEAGLESIVQSGTYKPAMEDINSLFLLAFRQIKYAHQMGIPEWIATETYYVGSIVQVAGVIFTSLQDTNLNKSPLTETTYWQLGINGDGTPGDYKVSAQTADHGRWLICTSGGRNVSRTTYAGLYAVIGTKYGTGDGSTTFGLPNTAGGKSLLIKDTSDTDFNDFGKSGGSKTHILTPSEGPSKAVSVTVKIGNNGIDHGSISLSSTKLPGVYDSGSDGTVNIGSNANGSAHSIMNPFLVGGNLFISYR